MQILNSTKSILDQTTQRMQKTADVTHHEFQSIRTGRASITLVESVPVDCYGAIQPLKSVASISTPGAKTIAIQPWDPSVIGAIEKALQKSDLGLTPNNDGKMIRINIPALTEERRGELDRVIRKIAEDGRVSIRNIRQEANEAAKRLEKDKTISEDESRGTQKKIQDLTNKYVKIIDELLVKKEQELKEV
ncbi:MAG: ribosome recycling factor [Candidatus Omnitrophica bacterium CG11_big_fil_rev_8_21_14_0_20_45_26]|uniref:Ribosome-recycling factor n=1 Tax=Candidatus Abzuiibacterium crystallinum TaxID=1974748 RepID=A0A2H0LRF4_9BACT|nr:MAG: ribosome recycling factor [Candidatus Omnitrophica bacterium CG11_big_fil_rev_8_21_14_0_20_45_26]PIW63190.1 MAG: ribosome recycling factor [Candidatus Omnitrophica bacterium CG12_big_fil_rev_8_21_14_0_65_45_16]